jgi:hypothetical protein
MTWFTSSFVEAWVLCKLSRQPQSYPPNTNTTKTTTTMTRIVPQIYEDTMEMMTITVMVITRNPRAKIIPPFLG